jgi:hypothetical protein
MLRRFLKFFKGDENGADERFEGSYLDHLLEQIRPTLIKQLQRCPEHDPVLLAVAGVLRATMLNAWALDMREPLVDKQTPGVRPPPAPNDAEVSANDIQEQNAPVASAPNEETLDFPRIDPPEADSEASADVDLAASEGEEADAQADDIVEEEDPSGDATEDEPQEAESDVSDDDIVEQREPENRSARITEEIDVSELQIISPPDRADRDTTVEMERAAVVAGALPRLDTPEVLQAGRVFLNLLVDNDRLPTDLQLSVSETTLARDLLLGYFVGSDDFAGKAKRLLTTVEKKFSDGLFSQARLLLQLFHTDESTRITNDRNLFYEDMILRLGIRRRHKITEEESTQLRERFKASSTDKGMRELFSWLDSALLVKLHLLGRSPHAHSVWSESIEVCSKPKAKERFLELIPAVRWRPADRAELPVAEQIRQHITKKSARVFVIAQIRTCYFVLRAVGDTGLEGYLDSFFDWTEREFGLNGTRLMPILYNRSMMESDSMTQILEEVYETHFAPQIDEKFASFNTAAVDKAFANAMKLVEKYDFGEVAPGYYDLGGFVFDELFKMTYPSREFAAKVHRIT